MTLSLSKGNRGLRSRAVKRLKYDPPCAAGSRAAAPSKPEVWLAGTKSSEARTKIPVPHLRRSSYSYTFPSAAALGSIIPPCGLQPLIQAVKPLLSFHPSYVNLQLLGARTICSVKPFHITH